MSEGRPTLTWIQANARWIGVFAVVGGGLAYVLDQVNPETISAWRVKDTKREIQICLLRVHVINNNKPPKAALFKCVE